MPKRTEPTLEELLTPGISLDQITAEMERLDRLIEMVPRARRAKTLLNQAAALLYETPSTNGKPKRKPPSGPLVPCKVRGCQSEKGFAGSAGLNRHRRIAHDLGPIKAAS